MSDQLEPQPPSHAPAIEPAPPVADPAKHATPPGKKSTVPKHINGQALVPAAAIPKMADEPMVPDAARFSKVLPGVVIGDFAYIAQMHTHVAALATRVLELEGMREGLAATNVAAQLQNELNRVHQEINGQAYSVGPFDAMRTLLAAEEQVSDRAWKSFTKHIKGRTGIAVVDGMRCEAEGAMDNNGCFMTPEQRTRMLGTFRGSVGLAIGNYGNAVERIRNQILSATHNDWGIVAEVLFGLATGPLIGLALKSFQLAKKTVEATGELDSLGILANAIPEKHAFHFVGKISDATVSAALTSCAKGGRDSLKARFQGLKSGATGDQQFLAEMRKQAQQFSLELVDTRSAQCTDLQLCVLTAGYRNLNFHSVEAYADNITQSLAQFHTSHIADIGTTSGCGAGFHLSTHYVTLQAGNYMRNAIVQSPIDAKSQNWLHEGRFNFVSWVSPELQELAANVMSARVGESPVVDVSGLSLPGAIGTWAQNALQQQRVVNQKESQ